MQNASAGVAAVAVGLRLPIHLSVVYTSQTEADQKLFPTAVQPSPLWSKSVYGPGRTVVWQGSAGDRRPYADQTVKRPLVSAESREVK